MIAKLWAKIPGEEQKLVLGLVIAVIGSGALQATPDSRYGVSFAASVAGVAIIRYLTDAVMRIGGTPNIPPKA